MRSSDRDSRRVLFLTSNYPRWTRDTTTPFVRDLAVDLRALNWHVSVLAPHAPGAARYEVLDGIEVYRFRYLLPERAQTVCYGGGALVNLRRSRLAKAKLPALVAAEWGATVRRLAGQIDVLHAHWTLPQGFVAATTPFRRVPRVLTVHGGDVFGLRGGVMDRFSAFTLRSMDRVTVNSSATEAAVADIAGQGVTTSRVPMGIDFSRSPRADLVARLRERYRVGDGPLVVFVGRIVHEKGVADIVEAIALLSAEFPGASAAIVGTGQHTEDVRAQAARRGVADRIHLPGWADPADVPSWFAAADVVLAPSRIGANGWAEGQGLSIIEAMAAGRPVVSSRTGGIPDTITDGETGLLVPPADPEALAAAVSRLVRAPELAASIADAGRESVLRRFDRSVTADRMSQIYDEILTARRSGRPV